MPDFSGVNYDEAMRRARSIVPTLRERAQKCEEARVLLPENEELLHETRAVPLSTSPRRFGGMELPFVAVVDIVAELARGCPSTAWNVGNLGCHHWILAYYEPETQHEVWDAEPGCADRLVDRAGGRPRQARGRRFVVSGKWPFSSGVDNSDWNMLAVTVYEDEKAVDWRLCLVPKSDYRIARHLVRDGHGRHRQQGHRGEGSVRSRAARPRPRPLPRRAGASRREAQPRPALPRADRGVRRASAFGDRPGHCRRRL